MRYSACLVICVAMIGCGKPKLTPEQIAVKEEICYWIAPEDVTFVKWWVLPAAQADLPQLFIDAALNKPESENRHYELLTAMKEKHEAGRYRHTLFAADFVRKAKSSTTTKSSMSPMAKSSTSG